MYTMGAFAFSPLGCQDAPCSEIYCEGSAVNGTFSLASASCCHHMSVPFHLSRWRVSQCVATWLLPLMFHVATSLHFVQHTAVVSEVPSRRYSQRRLRCCDFVATAIRLCHNVGWNCDEGDQIRSDGIRA